jgi:hypothetical protein
LAGLALQDNEAKKNGFYVDIRADGSFSVPHELERPLLRSQIWEAADMVKWCVDEAEGCPLQLTSKVYFQAFCRAAWTTRG